MSSMGGRLLGETGSPGSLRSERPQAFWQTWKLRSETIVPDIFGLLVVFVQSFFWYSHLLLSFLLTYQRERASLSSQGDSEHLEPLPQYVK